MRFEVEVITIRGSLPDFLGASCSDRAFSAPVVSMPMSLILRGAKKLQVGTAFVFCLTAVNIWTDLVTSLVPLRYH
jgi:hypothetical protein